MTKNTHIHFHLQPCQMRLSQCLNTLPAAALDTFVRLQGVHICFQVLRVRARAVQTFMYLLAILMSFWTPVLRELL